MLRSVSEKQKQITQIRMLEETVTCDGAVLLVNCVITIQETGINLRLINNKQGFRYIP